MEKFLSTCAAQNPNRRLRLIALADRVSMRVERADFDDLVTLVSQAPPWEKDRAGRRPHAAARDRRVEARRARSDPGALDVEARARGAEATRPQGLAGVPDAKRLLGALANSRGHRHEENAAKLVNAALEMPQEVGAALLASAEGYTPRATQLLEAARERLGSIQEVAGWIADNLPQPKTGPARTRRRRRRKKKPAAATTATDDDRRDEPRRRPAEACRGRRRRPAAPKKRRRAGGAKPAAAGRSGAADRRRAGRRRRLIRFA